MTACSYPEDLVKSSMDGLRPEKIRGGKASAELIMPIARRNSLRSAVLFNLIFSLNIISGGEFRAMPVSRHSRKGQVGINVKRTIANRQESLPVSGRDRGARPV